MNHKIVADLHVLSVRVLGKIVCALFFVSSSLCLALDISSEPVNDIVVYGDSSGAVVAAPHVGKHVFEQMITDAGVTVIYNEKLDRAPGKGVTIEGKRITAINTLSGKTYKGKMFIDATCVGDLMAAAGVTYTVGREPENQYGEDIAGVRRGDTNPCVHYGQKDLSQPEALGYVALIPTRRVSEGRTIPSNPSLTLVEVAHIRPGGPIHPMPVVRAGASHRIAVINKLRPEGPTHRLLCRPFRPQILFFARIRWLSPPADDMSGLQPFQIAQLQNLRFGIDTYASG